MGTFSLSDTQVCMKDDGSDMASSMSRKLFAGSVNKYKEKRALEILDAMKPSDEVESMLMLQMALTHDFILERLDERSTFGKSGKDLPTATKLMRLFTNQVLALNKYRAYNGPALTFNSVVADNAIVGDVHNTN